MTPHGTPPTNLDDTSRWQAVMARDRRFDGAFVYAVTSTGIYCRPGCPARTPRQANVRYFASPAEAETAGFRPCRRCRPGADALDAPAVVAQACNQMELDLEDGNTPDATSLAAKAGMTARQFGRAFQAATGLTPRAYAEARRLERLRDGLQGEATVTQAIYDAGFAGPRRVYELADTALGMTPARFGKGGAGERIRVIIADCSLGKLLVAATPKGLCRVTLGDDADRLRADLGRDFHAADLQSADAELTQWLAAIVAHLDAKAPPPLLPMDIQATAFQARVWQALMRVPRGETIGYGELARHVGAPGAARAVGTACGANPLALVIPCHRAVGADGALTGYRWGVERKRQLLAAEEADD